MFRQTILIPASKQCILRHLPATIKPPKTRNSKRKFKFLHSASSSKRLFKLWGKPQMFVRKQFSTPSTFIGSTFFFLKYFSPQLKNQTDSDSIINTLIIRLLIRNPSKETFYEQNITDAEKFNDEVINVVTQTECDNSTEYEISPNRIFLTHR